MFTLESRFEWVNVQNSNNTISDKLQYVKYIYGTRPSKFLAHLERDHMSRSSLNDVQ